MGNKNAWNHWKSLFVPKSDNLPSDQGNTVAI